MAENIIETVDLPADVAPGAMGLMQLSDIFQRAGHVKLAAYLRRCGDVVAVAPASTSMSTERRHRIHAAIENLRAALANDNSLWPELCAVMDYPGLDLLWQAVQQEGARVR
ncbi:MAG: hypothetical protein ACREP4_06510 [Stenotrophomonas sp.]|uniref:hypothetical protein n=1 Tax=Stenotrophomonas sp. TaxID=69392 RepID=UPI003D6D19F2